MFCSIYMDLNMYRDKLITEMFLAMFCSVGSIRLNELCFILTAKRSCQSQWGTGFPSFLHPLLLINMLVCESQQELISWAWHWAYVTAVFTRLSSHPSIHQSYSLFLILTLSLSVYPLIILRKHPEIGVLQAKRLE